MEWRDLARCVGQDSNIFFDTTRSKEAARWCDGCPVIEFCKHDANEYHSVGFWGGTNFTERANLKEAHNPVVVVWS